MVKKEKEILVKKYTEKKIKSRKWQNNKQKNLREKWRKNQKKKLKTKMTEN